MIHVYTIISDNYSSTSLRTLTFMILLFFTTLSTSKRKKQAFLPLLKITMTYGKQTNKATLFGGSGRGVGVGVSTVLFSKYTPLYDSVSNLFVPIVRKLSLFWIYLLFKVLYRDCARLLAAHFTVNEVMYYEYPLIWFWNEMRSVTMFGHVSQSD